MGDKRIDFFLNNSPVWFQNLGISAYGYLWHKRRFGGIFQKELKGYKERESFSSQQWMQFQDTELKRIITHAFNTVPYYRDKYIKAGLNLSTLLNIDSSNITKIPFLEKDELRQFGTSSLLSVNKEKGGSFFSSSGSTGTPTKILYSKNMHQRSSAAYEARVRHWAGLNNTMKRGMIGGRRIITVGNAKPPYYRYNFCEKQVYFSAYHIAPNTAWNYLEAIKKYNLDYMVGYAMSNYFLASFFENNGFEAPQLKAVVTSSEKLTSQMRDTFRKVYNCMTYDGWSGVESCGLVSQCEMGSLHISPDTGFLEILNEEGKNVGPGEIGEVVCTGLINYDQPLVRYKIGDSMKLSSRDCACGRKMPVIDEIIGRVEDVVEGMDGRKMVRFHGIFIDIPQIRAGQIIQYTQNQITIRLVVDSSFSPREESVMRKRIFSQLGEMLVEFEYVNKLPVNANGKTKAVISYLHDNKNV